MQVKTDIGRIELNRELRKKYSSLPQNNDDRIMDGISNLLERFPREAEFNVSLLQEVAEFISRRFDFKEVDFGLLDRSDGLYKYKVMIGHTKDSEKARSGTSYTYEQMFDTDEYPGLKITDTTWFSIETPLEKDRLLYSRVSLLGRKRTSRDSMIEGDYFDIFMYGPNEELIGWIELSNPRTGKLPSRKTIRWLEFIANIIARIIWEKEFVK